MAFGFFGGLWLLSRGSWMGFGDAKIAFSIALFLGWPGAIAGIVLAFWIGAVVAVGMLLSRQYGRKAEVPFAPFLALGCMAAYALIAQGTLFDYYRYILFI